MANPQIYYERDSRKVYTLHYVIFTVCKDNPKDAYKYARILARFCRQCKVWIDEDEPDLDDIICYNFGDIARYDDDTSYWLTRDCW